MSGWQQDPVSENQRRGSVLCGISVRHLRRNQDGPLHEWFVKAKWLRTFKQEEATWSTGAFANQNVACKLREPNTFKFLADKFGVSIPD